MIGLDCAEPTLVFEQWRSELPTLNRLLTHGAFGRLRSSDPPITVPAWASMLSGLDPGQLGFYGFRNRRDYSYEGMAIASGASVKADRVWDVAGKAGKRSVVVGVPQTYPVKPMEGWLVSCFLTPPGAEKFTWPPELKDEIGQVLDGAPYEVDVHNFRTDNKAQLLADLYRMTDKRFKVLHHLLQKPWDFGMVVEMGTDRIHHGFWAFMDPRHRNYVPGNPFENAIRDYYRHVDRLIGELLAQVGDDTLVMVVSDHGAKPMMGAFCINEWLIEQGLLVLKEYPEAQVPLEKCEVDWSRTKVWGSGGYYARMHFNVKGREPQGIIPRAEYNAFVDEMIQRLHATTDQHGRLLGTTAVAPARIYRQTVNIPPDLMVYFGDLSWRALGSVGGGKVHTFENDTGPDDANHDWHGIFIINDPRRDLGGRRLDGLQLQQVAPTILTALGVPVPPTMTAPVIAWD